MSEKTETLFEIDPDKAEVKCLGIPLSTDLDSVKILVNGVSINDYMKISSFKIVKVLK